MKLLLCTAGGLTLLTAALARTSAPAPPSAAATAPPEPAPATLRRIELPPESGAYRTGPGVELANAFCLTCHSVEYCQSQPVLPEKYWEATVKKMKEKFGATLPDETIGPLVKYLTKSYGQPPAAK